MIGLGLGLTRGGGIAPSLDLNFASGVMPAGLTFTRASTATYIGSDGLLKTAAVDVPRLDYDPVTLACKGLLIEGWRTNLLTYSSEFDNAAWPKTGLTPSADVTTAPDGTLTADRVAEDASTGFHRALRSVPVVSGQIYSQSFFVKASGRTRVNIHFSGAGAMEFTLVQFNLAAGTVVSGSGKIYPLGGGWYHISAASSAIGTGTGTFGIEILDAEGNRSYTGDGTSGIYVWGAQLEAGAFPSSYIPTTTAAVTRAADVCLMTGTNFSRWFNPTEGTIVAEFSTITNGLTNTGAAAYPRLFAFESSAAENMHVFVSGAGGSPIAFAVIDGGVDQSKLPIYGNTLGTGAVFRSVAAYKTNDFAHSLNGSAPATDTSGTLPVCDRLSIGSLMGAEQISGHIRRIRYYPRRLDNSRIQQLAVVS